MKGISDMENVNAENIAVSNNRFVYFDYLRVFASFAVILLHINGLRWYSADVNGEWQIFSVYASMVRCAVPAFIMISGALFLSRDRKIKTVYSKYILRMVTAFIFWGFIYAVDYGGSKKKILLNTIEGEYHMWFIPMIIGLYIATPILRKMIEDEKITKYFIAVTFVMTFMVPQILQLTKDFGGNLLKEVMNALNSDLENMDFHLVLGYLSYFVIGYYLNKIELSKKSRLFIYALGIAGLATTILLDSYLAVKTQTPVSTYYLHFTVNVLMQSAALFVWFKYHSPNCEWLSKIMSKLAKYNFGAYLVHILVIRKLDALFGLSALPIHPVLLIPLLSVIVFVISFIISGIINQIPLVKKYIV